MASHVIDSVFFKDLYGSEAMRAVFDDHNLLQKWLDYEAALARAEATLGLVPAEAAQEEEALRQPVDGRRGSSYAMRLRASPAVAR